MIYICVFFNNILYRCICCVCVCVQGMYFDRDDVALPKFSQYFMERATKEQEQAEQLLQYQNMRGGRVVLQSIAVSPHRQENRLHLHTFLSLLSTCFSTHVYMLSN